VSLRQRARSECDGKRVSTVALPCRRCSCPRWCCVSQALLLLLLLWVRPRHRMLGMLPIAWPLLLAVAGVSAAVPPGAAAAAKDLMILAMHTALRVINRSSVSGAGGAATYAKPCQSDAASVSVSALKPRQRTCGFRPGVPFLRLNTVAVTCTCTCTTTTQ
jgi:hypothetical protein